MRILFVNSYYYPYTNGGAELVCRKTAEALSGKGHEVDALTLDERSHVKNINGVNVIYLDTIIGKYRKRTTKLVRFFIIALRAFSPIAFFKYREILLKGKYDIINTHAIEDITPAIWVAAKSLKIPIVHTLHDRYLLCPRLFLLKRNGNECMNPKTICKLRTKVYGLFTQCVSAFISPSESLARIIPVDSVVINNGIKMSQGFCEKEYPDNRPFRFVFVGGLSNHKGIIPLINAFLQFRENAELHIAGNGVLLDEVLLATKKDPRIHYHGWVINQKMIDFLINFDCLVMPSICSETFPTIILEGFSAGLPVIASNNGGIPEMVVDNTNGYLFTPGSEEDIIEKMQMIMQKKNWEKFAKKIITIKDEYSIEKQVNKYEILFQKVLKASSHN